MSFLNWLVWALSFAPFNVIKGDNGACTENPDQQALLERASRADPAALGALYDQYADKIYATSIIVWGRRKSPRI